MVCYRIHIRNPLKGKIHPMTRKRTHATIKNVALKAGVSTATVSRVLAGEGYVATKTKEKVENAIAKLHYQPSFIAQSLRSKNSKVISLIVTDIQNPYYPELVRGVEDEAQKRGYSLILCNSAGDPEREISYINYLIQHRAEGIIICASGFLHRNSKLLKNYQGHIVLSDVDKDDSTYATISSDGEGGGELVGLHLVEVGYPQIMYIGDPDEEKDGYPRFNGLKKGAGKAPVHYFAGGASFELGARAAEEILAKYKPPFGVMAHNDLSAIGAMRVFLDRGYKVPEEIGVVGYDDIQLSAFTSPTLTTIHQDQRVLGMESLIMVDQLISGGKKPKGITIRTHLIARQSTRKKGK